MPEAITFYEVCGDAPLMQMFGEERTLFEAINNAGAVPQKALYDYGRRQGYSQATISRAMTELRNRGLIQRRTMMMEIK